EWGQNIKRETSSQGAATTEAQGESTPETTERNLEQNSGVQESQEGRAAETERKDHEKVDAQAGEAKANGGQGQVFDQGVDVQMSEEPDSELPEHKRESNASSERVEDADMTDMEAEKRAEREIDTPATVETRTKRQQKKAAASKLRRRSPTVRIRPQYKGNLTLQAEDEEHSQEVGTTMTSEQGQQAAEQASRSDVQGGAREAKTKTRKQSLSPKRKAAANWTSDRAQDMLAEYAADTTQSRPPVQMRSASPKRRTTEASRKGENTTRQQFIHQYMQATPGNANEAHIKTMAQHARETIYVLDVQSDGQARMQAYALHEVEAAPDMKMETGTVCPVPTEQALSLLRDLVAARITPPVMVLRWTDTGNHFQAVNYQAEKHEHYATNIAALSQKRNEILINHGWKALDAIEYDEDKTGRAAAQTIKAVRRAAKEAMRETELPTGVESGSKDRSPDSTLELESVPSKGQESSSAGVQRERFMIHHPTSRKEDRPTLAKEGRQDVLREAEEVQSTELSQSRTKEEQRDATRGIWNAQQAEMRQGQSNQDLKLLNQHNMSPKNTDGQHAQRTTNTTEGADAEGRQGSL
uniref:Uncharacterized protein n=2 Tax=Phytophthora ramorum TaxID=164328 RepID=H3H614_PHYRM